MSSESGVKQTLVIVVGKTNKRRCFKFYGDGSIRNSMRARELSPPMRSPGVRLVIKQKGKEDTEMLVWSAFTILKPPPDYFGDKFPKLRPSMFEVGTRLEFTAQSTSSPGKGFDPLPDFALKYWGTLTSNPNAPAETAFKVTELVGQSW